mgnify:CR=1 FL=1
MAAVVVSDYFYGEESEQFSYFRIPRLLVRSKKFKTLSTDAKLLYGLLLDRMGLSEEHGWYDEDGRVFIYYTVEEIADDLCCGRDKAMKLLAELDKAKGAGLIERVRQGQGKPTKIYVKRFTTREVPPKKEEIPAPIPEVEILDLQKSEIPTSKGRKPRLQEVGFSDPSYLDNNYPDSSYVSDNWVVSTLEDALSNWNNKLAEIWSLISQTPESFRGGEIWTVIVSIHNALVGFGYGLLVLFFAMGVFRSAASFRELQRPEFALRHFIRFLLAKVAVGSSLELITAIYKICGGVVSTVMGGIGSAISTTATLPDKIVESIEDVSFLESIPLWLVSLLGSLLITVLSFVLILTVYGRFFKIFIYTAIAPLPLASFAGEATSRTGQTFLRSYVGVCMEGAVIVLSCVIYSAFLSGGSTALDESLPAVTMVWQYIGQLMFNMLVLTGLVKGSDRLVHEMLGA